MESEGGNNDDKNGGQMLEGIPIVLIVSPEGCAEPQDSANLALGACTVNSCSSLTTGGVMQCENDTNRTDVTEQMEPSCSVKDAPVPTAVAQSINGDPTQACASGQSQDQESGRNGQLDLLEATVGAPVLSNILGQPPLTQQGTVATTIDESVLELSNSSNGQTTYLQMCKYDGLSSDSGLYECKWVECSEKFPHLEALVNHVNDKHVKVEREVEYRCHWQGCPRRGKGFNARYKMLIHIRTHTNERPHLCGVCSKSFSRLENLKIHMRSHTGEKPYTCPFEGCHKAYSNSSDRFKHVRTHQMDKPYCCKTPGCNKRYTDPSSLRKHIKTHGHHFRGDPTETPNLQETAQSSLDVSSSVNKTNASVPVTNTVFSLLPNGVMNHTLPTQVISIQGNMLRISTLASNPLLSSAIMPSSSVNTQTISTQTDTVSSETSSPETPTKDLSGESELLEESEKVQDTPLDLSTSPLSAHNNEDSSGDVVSAPYAVKWELMEVVGT